jgi:hypothetical protein
MRTDLQQNRHLRRSIIAVTIAAAIATTSLVEIQPASAAAARATAASTSSPTTGLGTPDNISLECTLLLIEKLLNLARVACPPGEL